MTYPHPPPGRQTRPRPAGLLLAGAAALILGCAPGSAAAGTGVGTGKTIPQPAREHSGSTVPAHTDPESRLKPAHTGITGAGPLGIDVSRYQGDIDWAAVAGDGIAFAYIKATKGTSHTDPRFRRNYTRSGASGMLRGAYHFALPHHSSGTAQARFFLTHGGNRADGKTLPPALDIEANPSGPDCYGLSPQQMTAWIAEFSATIQHHTGRHPVIYTTTAWWNRCTGGHGGFADTHHLWTARWSDDPAPLPRGWQDYTFWQYTAHGQVAGINGHVDRNLFHGDQLANLTA